MGSQSFIENIKSDLKVKGEGKKIVKDDDAYRLR
jgi:hypothetical protein